jgi:hypothetical protein
VHAAQTGDHVGGPVKVGPDTVFIGSFVLFAVAMLMLMKEPLMATWWAGLVPWAAAVVPWAFALIVTAIQYNQARLQLHKKYLFKG